MTNPIPNYEKLLITYKWIITVYNTFTGNNPCLVIVFISDRDCVLEVLFFIVRWHTYLPPTK